MPKEKVFNFLVTVNFDQRVHAKNKKEALEQLKESFMQDYNLELTDEEIELQK